MIQFDRSDLFTQINQIHLPHLILITAPSGYGKTVATMQLVQSLDMPYIWNRLEANTDRPTLHNKTVELFTEHYPELSDHTFDGDPQLRRFDNEKATVCGWNDLDKVVTLVSMAR